MKTGSLWKITVAVAPQAEEPVTTLLERLLGQAPVVYAQPESQISLVSVFLSLRSEWSPAKRRALVEGLTEIRDCGVALGPGKITVDRIQREDWAESWKKHFKPMVVGRALRIQPSWSRRQLKAGQAVVVLDPGLSFGTGQHPTTRFCLEQLVAFRRNQAGQSFIDVGTGSGILAIAAAQLGYQPVNAFDFDPDAVRIARANAAQNGVQTAIRLRRFDVGKLPLQSRELHDLVCANLTDDLLLRHRRRLVGLMHPRSRLVLAGILTSQFAVLREAYDGLGLRLVAQQTVGEWHSGAFEIA